MSIINNTREKWLLTNNTIHNISLGDLNAPILRPNRTYDLLKFATKEEISQSKNIITLLKTKNATLNKSVNDIETKTIDITEASESITSVELDELEEKIISEVTEGETITSETEGALIYGRNADETAQPISISGEENDEIQTSNIDIETTLEDIYIELVKTNMQMAIITENEIKNKDILSY